MINLLQELVATKKFIINADDFNLDSEATQGIIKARQMGIINSISVSVANLESNFLHRAPFEDQHIQYTGLHINLTQGRPLVAYDKKPTFISDNGSFISAAKLLKMENVLDEDTLHGEIMGQIERFLSLFKMLPSHLDCHQHVAYLSPKFFRALIRASMAFNIPIRCPKPFIETESLAHFIMRVEKNHGVKLNLDPAQRSEELHTIYHHQKPITRSRDIFIDVDFRDKEALVRRLASASQDSLEIICHPRLSQAGFVL